MKSFQRIETTQQIFIRWVVSIHWKNLWCFALIFSQVQSKVNPECFGKCPSETVELRAHARPAADGFTQTLAFTLRAFDDTPRRLPLQLDFVHFDDAEYNRRLAFAAAHATALLREENAAEQLVLHAVRLSMDRAEYNPESRVALRFDSDDGRAETASLQLQRVDANGIVTELKQNDFRSRS